MSIDTVVDDALLGKKKLVDDIILGEKSIDDVSLDDIDMQSYLFKTELDIWIQDYIHSDDDKSDEYVQKISNYILMDKNDLSEEKIKYFNSNIKSLLDEFAKNPIKSDDENDKKFAMRNNGVNYRVSHFFEVAKILREVNAPIEEVIAGLNHDAIEDFCDYYGLEPHKEGEKYDEKNPYDKFSYEATKKIQDITDSWNHCKDVDTGILTQILARVTRFNASNYKGDIGSTLEKDVGYNSAYASIRVKFADRIHNDRTTRPISERQQKILEKLEIKGESLFGFEYIKEKVDALETQEELEEFINSPEMEKLIADRKNNIAEHEKTKQITKNSHGLYHFFKTATNEFIAKSKYKDLIIFNQRNQFLKTRKTKNHKYDKLNNDIKKMLIDSSFENIIYQLNHAVNYHSDLKETARLIFEAKRYKGFDRATYESPDSNFDGLIKKYFEPLIGDKTSDYIKELRNKLNRPGEEDTEHEVFRLFLSLYHIFEKFEKNDNFYIKGVTSNKEVKYSQATQK